MTFAIRVEGLGKCYRLGMTHTNSIKELVNLGVRRLLRRPEETPLGRAAKAIAKENVDDQGRFWALRNVAFEVQQGEVLGIIGQNGAGKSTLLKILSQITAPTTGRVVMNGRVASLLEVGTGFHPELSGRENVFLNGALLGLTKAEIRKKFDEIIAFSEVEKFIDTPVKRYSSGMYVRLAFAIAAHLEPEILIVDEVLAVGDANFQKKCLGKIGEVGRSGRTVILVSHSMVAVNTICPRVIHIEKGSIVGDGLPSEIVPKYMASGANAFGKVSWPSPMEAPGNEKLRLQSVTILSRGEATGDVVITDEVVVDIGFWSLRDGLNASVSIHLLDKYGVCVLCSGVENVGRSAGLHKTSCTFPGNFLNNGTYSINVFLLTDATKIEVQVPQAVTFDVHETGGERGSYLGDIIGTVRVRLPWETSAVAPLPQTAESSKERIPV